MDWILAFARMEIIGRAALRPDPVWDFEVWIPVHFLRKVPMACAGMTIKNILVHPHPDLLPVHFALIAKVFRPAGLKEKGLTYKKEGAL